MSVKSCFFFWFLSVTYYLFLREVIENPWDDNLIRQLLSEVPKPISAYSNTFEWDVSLPVLKPKAQLKLGKTFT